MRKRKPREIADIQLRERLQSLRAQKKRIKKRRELRAELRRKMRETNRPQRDPQTKQVKLEDER